MKTYVRMKEAHLERGFETSASSLKASSAEDRLDEVGCVGEALRRGGGEPPCKDQRSDHSLITIATHERDVDQEPVPERTAPSYRVTRETQQALIEPERDTLYLSKERLQLLWNLIELLNSFIERCLDPRSSCLWL